MYMYMYNLLRLHYLSEHLCLFSQKKLLATEEDINPNRKFADNTVLQFISCNKMLREVIEKRKLNFWDIDFEYVDVIYKAILESALYKDYM